MAKEKLCVITADTHLAARAWAKHIALSGDSYYGLRQITDYCEAENLPLMIAGDIFDKTRPDPATIHAARQLLDNLEYYDIPVYYIQGQHELDRANPWLRAISPWAEHVDKTKWRIGDCECYGLDWYPSSMIHEHLQQIPKTTDLLLCHQVWSDFMGSHIGSAECCFNDVPHVSFIATGDYHKHLVKTATNNEGRIITILSPGSTCMQSIDEESQKAFFVLYDDYTYESVYIKGRNCFRVDIHDKESLEQFLSSELEIFCTPQENVPEAISKNILHIAYNYEIPEAYKRITSAINTQAHLFLIPKKQEKEEIEISVNQRRALAEGGLEACLYLVTKDQQLYRDVMLLLRSNDPEACFKEIEQQFKGKQ